MRFAPIPASLPATVPFTGPETLARRSGIALPARLGANESGFGPAPAAIAAMQAAAEDAWMYGDPDLHDLRQALAAHTGVSAAHIAIGEGIDGLLGLTVRLLIAPGDAVVTSAGAYPTFAFHVAGFGGTLHRVPYRADLEDGPALIAHAREVGARMVYLANPDNPMGSWQAPGAIEALLADLPPECLLILDEAYAEFLPDGALPRIDPADPRVLRFRTFSKVHGLAGLRVGYAIGAPGLVAAFDRVRNHFGVGRIAQAGALGALSDPAWVPHIVAQVAAARERIAQIGAASGLRALPSATNFVALDTGRDGLAARALVDALGRRGVFVRMPGVPPLDRCIRVSCGPEAALDAFAAALPEAAAEAYSAAS